MYEVGAKVLDLIPDAVKAHTLIEFSSLPRIMASCDALVNDEGSGRIPASSSVCGCCHCLHCPAYQRFLCHAGAVVRIMEAKHRFPFLMPKSGAGHFTYMGRSRGPQSQVSCEQSAQCQLQMLVVDVDTCDLITYSLGSSKIFRIRRNNECLLCPAYALTSCVTINKCLEASWHSIAGIVRGRHRTRKVQEAVNRIKKPVVLEALYTSTKHSELTQGTSGNENWHSWVRRTIPILGVICGLQVPHISELADVALQQGSP